MKRKFGLTFPAIGQAPVNNRRATVTCVPTKRYLAKMPDLWREEHVPVLISELFNDILEPLAPAGVDII